MQGGFQHFHYIIGSDLTLFASNHTGTRLIHHRKPSVHQLPAALSLFARCWLNLATLLSVLKAFTAILYCTEIQYLLKCGRRSILFATATASMRAQSGPYLGVLDLTRTERHSSVLCVVWATLRSRPTPCASTAARGNLSMLDIHHRPRKRDASETGVRRCIGFVLSKNLSPVYTTVCSRVFVMWGAREVISFF